MINDKIDVPITTASHPADSGSFDALTTTTSSQSMLLSFVVCLLLFIVLLFNVKSPIQFYVKYAVYVCITMTFSLFTIPFAILRPNSPKNVDIVAVLLTWLFKIFRVNVELENAEYLQINQPYILICNHQSSLDFMTMMRVWPGGNCTPLAKKELIYAGPFGIAIWLCGITFIDRLNPDKARGTIDQLAIRINEENLRVWIYPEGTRNNKTKLLPFKKGAFHLAVQAQIPIVCLVTSSYSNFYNKREKKFLPNGYVKCRALPPFQTRGMSIDSVSQLTKHLQDRMQKEFDMLNEEIGLEKKYYSNDADDENDERLRSQLAKANLSMNSESLNESQLMNNVEEIGDDDDELSLRKRNKVNSKLNYSDDDECEAKPEEERSVNLIHKSMSFSDDNNNSMHSEDLNESKKSL